jgi:hypothetical protein
MSKKTLIHYPGLPGPIVHKTPEELEADRIANWRRANPPVRFQRSRAKGWKKPPGAVYVGRGTVWGNPHVAALGVDGDLRRVVRLYHEDIRRIPLLILRAKKELAGKDLMCWCELYKPCHADVLIHIANQPVDLEDFPVGLDGIKLVGYWWKHVTFAVDRHEYGKVVLQAVGRHESLRATPAEFLEILKF